MANFNILGKLYKDLETIDINDTNGDTHSFVEALFGSKTITQNGTYYASSDGYNAYYAVTVNVPSPSGSITITQNGTHDVTNYASAVVNVSGGASNYVTGTFNYDSSGAKTLTIPYSGSGYPLILVIFPVGGFRGNTTFYNTLQRYAINTFTMVKSEMATTPTYTTSGTNNYGVINVDYKNSTSTASSITRSGTANQNEYTTNVATSSNSYGVAKFASNTSMSLYVASSSYGFMQNIDYEYHIIYSS